MRPVDARALRQRRWLENVFAAAAGAGTSLAFPPTGFAPAAIAGPILLLALLQGARRRRRGALLGFLFGLGFFGTLLNWTVDIALLAWVALSLAQSAFTAIFGAIVAGSRWARTPSRPPLRTVLVVAVAWTGIEVIRGAWPLGGFTWGSLGYAFVGVPGIRDLASLGGVALISMTAMIAAGLVARATLRPLPGEGRGPSLKVLASLGAIILVAIVIPRPSPGEPLDVAVVQGNVPEDAAGGGFGRRGRVGPEDFTVVENHLEVTEQLLTPDGFPPDLVVWPENAFDRDPDDYPQLAEPTQALIDAIGSPFIVGAIVSDPDGSEFNANLLWRPDLGIDRDQRYEKHHLVPFGEFVPWGWPRDLVPQLRAEVPSDLTAGTGTSVLEIDGMQVGTVICFESAVARDVRRAIDDGAEVLVVTTNNSSFGRSAASEQHLQTSRMRALEHRMPVIHAAISGISAVIGPNGELLERSRLFEPELLRHTVRAVSGRTVYANIGGPLEGLLAALAGLMLLGTLLPGRLRSQDPDPTPRPPLARVMVSLPTFNEAATLEATVAAIRAALPAAHILIVDDASPDGTGDIADRLAASDEQVSVLHRPAKAGLASAYIDAFRLAFEQGFTAVIEMDADGSHDPADLPRLVGAGAAADVVIGARWVPGGKTIGWSPVRKALSRTANIYARAVLGLEVRDSTSGFRLYRRPVLEAIGLSTVRSEGYAFQVEMTHRAFEAGATVTEVPIVFRERRGGASKMSKAIVIEALWRIPWLALTRRSRRGHTARTRQQAP